MNINANTGQLRGISTNSVQLGAKYTTKTEDSLKNFEDEILLAQDSDRYKYRN